MTAPAPKDRRIFDGAFLFLLVLALMTGALAVWLRGPSALREAADIVIADAVLILPMIALGVTVGALFTMLVPRQVVGRHLGREAGIKGIFLASFVGTVMPAGPFAAFPIVLALGRSGAGIGPLVAFLTAWAAVGLNRLFIWELPFMGGEFALLRFVTSLPIPVVAGLAAQHLAANVPGLRVQWDDL